MKIKTSDLEGHALNWAVAMCVGLIKGDDVDIAFILEGSYSPSTNRAQGDPIIDLEAIFWAFNGRSDRAGKQFKWLATKNLGDPLNNYYGPTILIATMRCFVANELGFYVEIPNELVLSI